MSFAGPFGTLGVVDAHPGLSRAHLKRRFKDGIPTHADVPGLFVEERDAPKSKCTRHFISGNSNWKHIPTEKITAALAFYDSDQYVQDAVKIKLNHILGAGITFKRRFHKMDDAATLWHSEKYSTLLRNIYRSLLSLGFAVWTCIPHEDYVGEPVLLDLETVDVFMISDMFGRVTLKYFPKHGVPLTADLNPDVELENMHVIMFTPPRRDGTISSIADALEPDYLFEKDLQLYSKMACKLKCFPALVSQQQSEKRAPADFYSAYSVSAQQGNQGAAAGRTVDHRQTVADEAQRARLHAINAGRPVTASDWVRDTPTHMLMANNQVWLDADRTLARVEQAQEPNHYIAFSEMREKNVRAWFCIPPGVAGGKSSDRGSTTGASANSMTIYNNDQKQIKNRFISIAKTIYGAITNSVNVLELVLEGVHDKRRKRDDGEIKAIVETEVDMPGIPEDQVIWQLYMMGFLTYDAVCDLMHGKYAFTRSSFCPKPSIDVKLLNGIQPEPPKVPSSSSSKR